MAKILQRSGLRSGCSNNDGIFHRAVFFELTHDLSNGGVLLADGNIDAVELLALIVALIGGLLVDEGVDGDSGLAGLAVADDQLELTAAAGNQRVNGLEEIGRASCRERGGKAVWISVGGVTFKK